MSTTPTYGVTATGFNEPTGIDIYNSLIDAFQQQFPTIDTNPQSISGQFVAIFSKTIADIWDNMAALYGAAYPSSAQGIALDGIAQIVGLVRKPATYTQTYLACTGTPGTIIPLGASVNAGINSTLFLTTSAVTISTNSCCLYTIGIPATPTAGAYSVTINTIPCSYYELLETFTGSFVTGNEIAITINGVFLGTVSFDTDNQTTINDMVALINGATPQLATASSPSSTTLLLVPASGIQLSATIAITGGTSQPTVTQSYSAPSSQSVIQSGLIGIINASSIGSACIATASSTSVLLTATSFASPLIVLISTPLTTVSVASPALAAAQTSGAVDAAIGTLTTIVSPVYGWTAVNNPNAPVIGSAVETDAALRLRIFSATASNAYATVAALTAKLLAITGVSYVQVIENTTLTQLPTTIQFSSAFVAGNTIAIAFNGSAVPTVLYAGSQAATIAAIIASIETYSAVASATSPTSTSISINWDDIGTTKITTLQVVGGATTPSATHSDGVPPLSIECIVDGTNSSVIGQTIYDTKAAGVQTFGNVTVAVVTPNNTTTNVYYQQPVPVYIWIQCAVTGTTSAFSGAAALQSAILAFGQGLGVGSYVYYGQVLGVALSFPGVTSATLTIAYTATSTQNPTGTFASSNVPILGTQISSWSASRILVTV